MANLLQPHTNHVQTGVTRDFGTVFMIDPDYATFVAYTIEMNVQAPLLSTQEVSVSLMAEGNNPPVVEVDSAHLESGQLAGLGLVSIAVGARQVLVGWVPAGTFVQLVKTGAGTATIVGQLEVTFDDQL